MRYFFIVAIVLSQCSFILAQDKKNEIQIGVWNISFLDKNHFKLVVPIPPVLHYSRKIDSRFSLFGEYSYFELKYPAFDRLRERDEVEIRILHFTRVGMKLLKKNKGNANLGAKLGLAYRHGGELVHLKYNLTQFGDPWESVSTFYYFSSLGASIELEMKYLFWQNCSVGANFGGTYFFAKRSPKLLNLGLFLGYEF
ncbi:MAG TPA: hypothetical protein ENK91_17020 [Bacteroidetes bacterium]|nr:hypothetical protein [Bacteroidota bacterium]